MLRDDEKRRQTELEKMFGVDFGENGERELGLELRSLSTDYTFIF